MNFLIQVHRSIVDPSYYAQVITLPIRKIVLFILKLVLFTALIMSFMHTMRVVNPIEGLPAILPLLFPDMVITHDGMYSNRETPYSPNPIYVADFLSTYIDAPASSFDIPDSFVVVDCRNNLVIDKKSSVMFLFAADTIHVNVSPDLSLKLPYSYLALKNEPIAFTQAGISSYLKSRLLLVMRNIFILHFVLFGFTVASSIFLLSIAAIILKRREQGRHKSFVKIAAFAITPIAIQNILVALSGAKIVWLWYVSICVSTYILFRAFNYLSSVNEQGTIRRSGE